MAHSQNKPGREKRKPKKEKTSFKTGRDAEVLEHVAQHPPKTDERS